MYKKNDKQHYWQLYCSIYPNFTSKSVITFDKFLDMILKPAETSPKKAPTKEEVAEKAAEKAKEVAAIIQDAIDTGELFAKNMVLDRKIKKRQMKKAGEKQNVRHI